MAFRISYRLTGPADYVVMDWPVAANQTITRGTVLALSSGLAAVAAPGASSVLGVALADKTTGASPASTDTVPVALSPDIVFEVDYVGSVKTSLTDADRGAAFDLNATGDKINLDDTTGGMCKVIKYDNARSVAYVLIGNRVFTV